MGRSGLIAMGQLEILCDVQRQLEMSFGVEVPSNSEYWC